MYLSVIKLPIDTYIDVNNMSTVYPKCALIRILSIFVIQTYFVPDEYWQSLEVAHSAVFNYGFRTWEFKEEIRSIVYPSLFFILYFFLHFLKLDSTVLLIYAPRVFQALITAAADTCLYNWCRRLGFTCSNIWLIIIFDWFNFYCGSRTLINTFESNLVVFSLVTFPWESFDLKIVTDNVLNKLYKFCILVTINCYIRPTACVIWGPFCLLWFLQTHLKKTIVLRLVIPATITAFVLCFLDSLFYKHLSFTPWNFLYLNVFQDISSFYGSHPVYWYFTQGIPVVLGVFTVPFLLQTFQTVKITLFGCKSERLSSHHVLNTILLPTVGCALVFYSLVPHKEFRFILPLAPMMMIVALQKLDNLRRSIVGHVFNAAVLVGFLVPTLLFGQLHQRGSLSVMQRLTADAAVNPEKTAILFLTPCHATPLYSHLHIDVPTRFVSCEPPLAVIHGYKDESEIFFENPLAWLEAYWHNTSETQPTHIVMFDGIEEPLNDFLINKNFSKVSTVFHTIFPEGRVGKNIFVYKYRQFES